VYLIANLKSAWGWTKPPGNYAFARDVPMSTQVRLIPPTLGAGLKLKPPGFISIREKLLITALKLNPNKENAT